MSLGSADFIEEVREQLQIGDRQIRMSNSHALDRERFDSVYVNYVNLPEGIGGEGGGAEAGNNRTTFWIEGFDRKDPHAPPPTGKVKIKMSSTALPREYVKNSFRAKTASPEVIAKYLAAFLNKVAAEIEPRFTHTRV